MANGNGNEAMDPLQAVRNALEAQDLGAAFEALPLRHVAPKGSPVSSGCPWSMPASQG